MVTKSFHTVFLDWLRFSVPLEISNSELLPPHETFDATGEILKSYPNYTQTIALLAGRIDWNEERPEQRKLVTLTGEDLLTMRRAGVDDDKLAKWIDANEDLNVPRLDIAVDTRNAALTPAKFYAAWQQGKLSTKARKITRVQGRTEDQRAAGYTVYVGSRQSEKFLRIYDKNAEQKAKGKEVDLPDELWTRIEIELKGGMAVNALRHIAQHGISSAGWVIAQFCDWAGNAVWQDLKSGNIAPDLSVGRKETDHETWLRKVVFPNFEKALRTGNDRALRIVAEHAERAKLALSEKRGDN